MMASTNCGPFKPVPSAIRIASMTAGMYLPTGILPAYPIPPAFYTGPVWASHHYAGPVRLPSRSRPKKPDRPTYGPALSGLRQSLVNRPLAWTPAVLDIRVGLLHK